MKDKELKDMTLNELLESDLSLEDIDEVIEEQLETRTEEQTCSMTPCKTLKQAKQKATNLN